MPKRPKLNAPQKPKLNAPDDFGLLGDLDDLLDDPPSPKRRKAAEEAEVIRLGPPRIVAGIYKPGRQRTPTQGQMAKHLDKAFEAEEQQVAVARIYELLHSSRAAKHVVRNFREMSRVMSTGMSGISAIVSATLDWADAAKMHEPEMREEAAHTLEQIASLLVDAGLYVRRSPASCSRSTRRRWCRISTR